MSDSEYWFCLTHHAVEGREGCKNADRLGPYPSQAEAARALEKVQTEAEAAGVFGVPSLLLPDGDLYWGREHFARVRQLIEASH